MLRELNGQLGVRLGKVEKGEWEKAANKNKEKAKDPKEELDGVERQMESNCKVLEIMRVEYEGLNRRRQEIQEHDREHIERETVQMLGSIESSKKELRELKRDNIKIHRQMD